MTALSAINPNGACVVYANGGSGESGSISTNGLARRGKGQAEVSSFLESITYNPELKPFAIGLHGLANVDWVAVWFF